MKITDNMFFELNNFVVFSRQYRNEERMEHSFFQLYLGKIKHINFVQF